ncbi:AraC family transcriptional regulator [Streptomyces sp. MST-110588]|uniref:AraC family transcriptional regulator n=1 Tax=Streptomyces sp. MST-110588 TaxID=2833628 RepID=UPI001F5C7AB8|nr:AraC family transcriptional regulator [Streptomyces sp. MST-110588]UNO41882.1 helix-turn-helix transcriptional regulator [Streptomyces sp. MST-110588]
MVKKGHAAVRGAGESVPAVTFTAPAGRPAGVEVLTLAELRGRADACALAVPHRPDFHHLLVVDEGRLWHTVDFRTYELSVNDWIWVRPGQVHHFGDLSGAQGRLVLFESGFLDAATAGAARLEDWFGPAVHHPEGEQARAVDGALRHLHEEFGALRGLPWETHIEVLRHLLAVLVLRAARMSVRDGGGDGGARGRGADVRSRGAGGGRVSDGADVCEASETFLRFRDAVERGFTRSRRVEDYARQLGYSPRTLSRATAAATGVGAKEFIDRRVVLEAKRLLAHGDQTAARIAVRLGFADAANFAKFFQHRTGSTPISFRTEVRGAA